MSKEYQEKKVINIEKNKSKVQIITALIGAVALIIVAMIELFPELGFIKRNNAENTTPPNVEISICKKIKKRAENLSLECDVRIEVTTDDRAKLNLLYWRDQMLNISKDNCENIDNNFKQIFETFEGYYKFKTSKK